MKIPTIMTTGIFLIASSVAWADSSGMNHYDVMQDELWHGAETVLIPSANSSVESSVNDPSENHYDVMQDEFWHGAETAPRSTSNPTVEASVNHYDVTQDEFWHGG